MAERLTTPATVSANAVWRVVWALVRLATAGLGIAALAASLENNVSRALNAQFPPARDLGVILSNWFSFFTMQSNIATAVTFVIGAVLLVTGIRTRRADPRWYAILLVCVTTYMVVTSVVYNILLRPIPIPAAEQVPWANEVLHVWVPIVLVLDLLIAPGRRALRWRVVWIAVIYPLAWGAYTFIRGPFVVNPGTGQLGWYPYPFLDVSDPAAWPSAIAYVVVLAAAMGVLAVVVVAIGRLRARLGTAVGAGAGAGASDVTLRGSESNTPAAFDS